MNLSEKKDKKTTMRESIFLKIINALRDLRNLEYFRAGNESHCQKNMDSLKYEDINT